MSAHTSILRVSAAGAAGAALLAALQPTSVRAQSPGTDVYVVPLLEGASGAGEPRNLTRRAGYDNQPAFSTDGAFVLYTSIREDQQADIWRVALPGAEPERLTSTPESEYSPTIVPGTGALATVRVEADSTQRLWWFRASDVPAVTGRPRGDSVVEPLVPELAPVGYFAFATPQLVAAFVLGEPSTLQVVRTGRNAPAARVAARDVGRSIHPIPGQPGAVSYVQMGEPGSWIMGLRPANGASSDSSWRIAPTLPDAEDYAWAGPDLLLMASGSVLNRWHVGRDTTWMPIADLAGAGVREITRLAVSPDGGTLAFVAQDAGREASADVDAAIAEAWLDLSVLSADSLLGRQTGTAGEKMAARYLADRFAAAGLQPAGDEGGFLQFVPIAVRKAQATVGAAGRGVQVRALQQHRLTAELADARLDSATNVIGIIPGGDPAVAHEVVLVTAHFDHVGIGRPVDGDSIYNGADDDASGTAAMLEIARRLTSGPAPRRTIVFASMTGEEVGLIGTRWYIANPAKPLESTIANLNLEMLARPDTAAGGPGRAWLTGSDRSTMFELMESAGVPVVADPRPAQNFFERSDNIAFARLGIVAHTLSSYGMHSDYHRPSDELETVDAAHFAAVIEAATMATRALADGEVPAWKPGGRPAAR